jgi:hypothetical protein
LVGPAADDADFQSFKKAVAAYRSEIAAVKRRVGVLEKEVGTR